MNFKVIAALTTAMLFLIVVIRSYSLSYKKYKHKPPGSYAMTFNVIKIVVAHQRRLYVLLIIK